MAIGMVNHAISWRVCGIVTEISWQGTLLSVEKPLRNYLYCLSALKIGLNTHRLRINFTFYLALANQAVNGRFI